SILVPSVDSYQIHEFSEDTNDSRDLRKFNNFFLSRRASLEHWYIERLYLDSIVVGHRRKGWNVNDHLFRADLCPIRNFILNVQSDAILCDHVRDELVRSINGLFVSAFEKPSRFQLLHYSPRLPILSDVSPALLVI